MVHMETDKKVTKLFYTLSYKGKFILSSTKVSGIFISVLLLLLSGTSNAAQDVVLKDGMPPEVAKIASPALATLFGDIAEGYTDSHFKYDGKFQLEIQFKVGSAKLREDLKDAFFVEVIAPGYCGSGGCTIHIVQPTFDGAALIEVSDLFGCASITVLDSTTNSMRDILSYDCKYSNDIRSLKYDGKKYSLDHN